MLVRPDVMIDRTHMHRRASGIERLTDALFSAPALAPLQVGTVESSGSRAGMVLKQAVVNPANAIRSPGPVWVFPGYPPSPAFRFLRERTVLYVHDLFLLTRRQDLNWAATLYLAPMFRQAVTRLRYFLVNSMTTGGQLAAYVGADAEIRPYRPRVENVFGLQMHSDQARGADGHPLIVGALGTVEPRKNFLAVAQICRRLAAVLQQPVELHLIGRPGWGGDFERLSRMPHVRLYGFLSDSEARRVIESFDLFLCTSHDEGLGLPLLEMQYAGLPVIAPDKPVFREVLGFSGTFIDPADADGAAAAMASLVRGEDWRASSAALAQDNVARWNRQAEADRADVVSFLAEMRERGRHAAGRADTRDRLMRRTG